MFLDLSSKIITKTVIALIVLIIISAPASTLASNLGPSCSLTISTKNEKFIVDNRANILIEKGDEMYIQWNSQNALTATDDKNSAIPLSGQITKSPTETEIYYFTFEAGEEKTICQVRVYTTKEKTGLFSFISNLLQSALFRLTAGKETAQVVISEEGDKKKFSRSNIVTVRKETAEIVSLENMIEKKKVVIEVVKPKPVVPTVKVVPPPPQVTPPPPEVLPPPQPIITIEPPINVVIPDVAATTLAVEMIPLLSGGIAKAGASVPVSYLQVQNVGLEPAYLRGFWMKQSGEDLAQAVISLTTIDDRGGSRGFTGGIEGLTPFKDGVAYAPIAGKLFAPGETRLFTIKAVLSTNVSAYLGKQIKLDVSGIDTNAQTQGLFPIRGTTWTISY